jgi:hypothetical protein
MGVKLGLLHGGGERLRVFENRVLRKIFGPKKKEVRGTGRDCMHNEQLHGLQTPPNFIQVAKPSRMRWQVWGEDRYIQGFGKKT